MALNPIVYTEKVVRSFLKYQLSAYPFADANLNEQMREQLSLDSVRQTPLLQGPYFSLSRGFREGATIAELTEAGVFHPHMQQLIPDYVKRVYGHQEKAMRAIHAGKPTLVSTGTGSGKTECFLYPIISTCLELRDLNAPAGISAVLVYPMNALAEDQLDRLRGILAGSGIPFGMYVGKTPEYEREVSGYRMPPGSSNSDYQAKLSEYREAGRSDSIHPVEEICSREMMRTGGKQPRILLTNVKQLELLLTRQQDVELFADARLDFLVFDEAHTFTGIQGAETACLIRRLRTFCGKGPEHTTCIATSATIVDQQDPDAVRKFASRFFGVSADAVETVNEEYQLDSWSSKRKTPVSPPGDHAAILRHTLEGLESDNVEGPVRDAYCMLTGDRLPDGNWQEALFDALRGNEIAAKIAVALQGPRKLVMLLSELEKTTGRPVSEEELLIYMALGAVAFKNGRPLMRPVAHGFIRGISGGVVTFPQGNQPKLWLSSADELAAQQDNSKVWRPRLFTCTTCGQHYFVTSLKDFEFTKTELEGGQLSDEGATFWEPMAEANGGSRVVLLDKLVSQDEEQTESLARTAAVSFCRHCGTAHQDGATLCCGCSSASEQVRLFSVRSGAKNPGYLSSCLSCGARGKAMGRRYREPIRELRATNVSDVHVLAQDMIHHADRKRLLLFTDNRQDAAFQAGWMKDHARRFRLRSLMADAIAGEEVAVGDIAVRMSDKLDENDALSRVLIPEVWRAVPKEGSGGTHADERLHFLRIQVLREVTMASNQQIGLEPWGRIKVRYENLSVAAPMIQKWSRTLRVSPDDLKAGIEALLDHLRRRRLLYDARRGIFSRYWMDGDREIQRGYMPLPQGVQGMKLVRAADDKPELVFQWHSRQPTLVSSIAKKWGISNDDMEPFLKDLWEYLTDPSVAILVPVTLKSGKDRPLPNCTGVYQIDAAKLRVSENTGFYRCNRCRRKVSRRPPLDKCLAWQCDGKLEYPVCQICGYSVSPLASERQLQSFREGHTERCGKEPVNVGFYADVVADALTLTDIANTEVAYRALEALRMASAQVLDMHLEDLRILVLAAVDRDEVTAALWDPMPGGSGLLDQIVENFPAIIAIATTLLSECPSDCADSCNDCLQTFRNGFYHKHLNRHTAIDFIVEHGCDLSVSHSIPASQGLAQPTSIDLQPVNDAETKLKHLLEAAGFTSGQFQQQIRFRHRISLGHQIGSTTPDVYFSGDEDDPEDQGVCIYLDGLSSHLHGNSATAEIDNEIRSWLKNNGYQVISISHVDLSDKNAMKAAFRRLAKFLSGKDLADRISSDTSWFVV